MTIEIDHALNCPVRSGLTEDNCTCRVEVKVAPMTVRLVASITYRRPNGDLDSADIWSDGNYTATIPGGSTFMGWRLY